MIDNEQIELKPRAKTAGTPVPEVLSPDDTGSQALSEALQSSFSIVKLLMLLLVVAFICSGVFSVESGQQAIILRFGKPVGEGQGVLKESGIHWAFPRPIDEVKKVSIGQIQTASSTVGWYAQTPAASAGLEQDAPPGPSLDPRSEGYALTSDANIIHVRATLRYTITDPIRFLFDFDNAAEFVTNALNNSILFAAAQYTVDDALTHKRAPFRESVSARLQELINQQQLGVVISQIDVNPIPPRQVAAEFERATQAGIKTDDELNKAKAYANTRLSKAQQDYESRLNEARTESSAYVSQLRADAKQFSDLLPEYKKNPELFMRQRQAEVLGNVYENAQDIWYLPRRSDGQPRELRLQVNREPKSE